MTFMGADTDQLRDLGNRMRVGIMELQSRSGQAPARARRRARRVSAGMDIGRAMHENAPAVKNLADNVGGAIKNTAGAIGDGLSKIGDGFTSLFG